MKTGGDPRHKARRVALGALFEWSFYSHNPQQLFEHVKSVLEEPPEEYDDTLTHSIIGGVIEKIETIDQIISSAAPQWPIDQISKVDHTCLRISVYELYLSKKNPPKVAIGESIDLAKEFMGSTSGNLLMEYWYSCQNITAGRKYLN